MCWVLTAGAQGKSPQATVLKLVFVWLVLLLFAKNSLATQETQETWIPSLGQKDPLEEGVATHSSILARKIPWSEEPSRPRSKWSQRGKDDCSC